MQISTRGGLAVKRRAPFCWNQFAVPLLLCVFGLMHGCTDRADAKENACTYGGKERKVAGVAKRSAASNPNQRKNERVWCVFMDTQKLSKPCTFFNIQANILCFVITKMQSWRLRGGAGV